MLTTSKRTIDLILCDIRMPNGNGIQLLQALRTGRIKGMRINATFVLTTTAPTAETVKFASSLDANGYVIKPVFPDKLQAALLKARRTVFPPDPARYADVTVPSDL
jgi:CheY-like chemotaxis protein